MKKLCIFLFIIFSALNYGQSISFEELQDKIIRSQKPILIKIEAPWCSVCKIQNKQIEKDRELKKILSEKYYYLELDAETKQDIIFNNKTYSFVPQGLSSGTHELASELNDNSQAYPAWILLTSDYKIISRYNGLIKAGKLKKLLK